MTKPQKPLPDSANCAWCETPFKPRSILSKFCSLQCGVAHGNTVARHQCGPCPECGCMFASRRKNKKFCSLDCYLKSDQIKQQALRNAISLNPATGTPRICEACGGEFERKHKRMYCSDICRRRFFAERFDRWIANPEGVALPQNFDEFLTQEELPCLVPGCEWKGKKLGNHVNFVHGITARDFKKLAGFNLGSGLVTPDISETQSAIGKAVAEANGLCPPPPKSEHAPGYISLERRERAKKTRSLMAKVSDKTKPCRQCGKDVAQPTMGMRLYCSTICRSAYYGRHGFGELPCAHCGSKFQATKAQLRRARKHLPVCCGELCRNQMNMVACLASRGVSMKTPIERGTQ
jgi:hypothetical protein